MITFSDGLTFAPNDVLNKNTKIFDGVLPHHWIKIKTILKQNQDITKLANKIAKKSSERIAVRISRHYNPNINGIEIILAFENDNDAFMFKMRGIEWYENTN